MKSSKNYNFIFFIVWGALFGGIPLFIMVRTLAQGDFEPMLIIFVIIGFFVFGLGVLNFLRMLKDITIGRTGKDAVGYFISEKGIGSYNGVPMFRIVYGFKNDNGEDVEVESIEIFTQSEMENIKDAGVMKIKYIGKTASIVSYSKSKIRRDICEYCGAKYDGEKCPSCGAPKNYKFK